MLNAKAEPDLPAIQLLVETLLDIVFTCSTDLAAQTRWGALLNRLLRSHRRKLKLTIQWRPLYTMLRRYAMEPSLTFDGIGVGQARNKHLMGLIHRGRRFFPPGSAAEIWAEFAPTLRDVSSPDAFEALGWLAVLMPTRAATGKDGDWATWVAEWMDIWASVTHIHYWQALWMGLFTPSRYPWTCQLARIGAAISKSLLMGVQFACRDSYSSTTFFWICPRVMFSSVWRLCRVSVHRSGSFHDLSSWAVSSGNSPR